MGNKKKQGLKLWSLVGIALGAVVGAGVVTLTGQAIAVTGRSAWLAYVVATFAGFFMVVPYMLLVNCIRPRGGNYTLAASMLGTRMAGFVGLSVTLNVLNIAVFGSGFGQYFNVLFPEISPKAGAIIGITFFFILNIFGVALMAKVQGVMSVILFGGLTLFIILGMRKMTPGSMDFSAPTFFTGGGAGFAAAVMLLIQSTFGYKNIINFAGEAEHPKRDLPRTMLITACIILFLYVGIALVNTGVLPIAEVAGQPLTNVARSLMPGPLYYVFLIGGPLAALATTINGAFAIFATPIRQAAEDGWFPKGLTKTNKHQVPYLLYVMIYMIGIIPIIAGLSIRTITSNVVLVISFNEIIAFLAVFRLPEVLPDAWEQRYYKVSVKLFKAGVIFAIILRSFFIVLSLQNITPLLAVITITLFIVFFIYATIRAKSSDVKVTKSYDLT